jgi:transposase
METYSMDLRERVVRACDEKRGGRGHVAKLFGVSTAWIRRLLQRRREVGTIAPKPHGGGRPAKFFGKKLERLKQLVEQQPDATLAELLDRSGVDGSIMAVHRALERLESRLKKSPSMPASKTGRTSKRRGKHGGVGRAALTR